MGTPKTLAPDLDYTPVDTYKGKPKSYWEQFKTVLIYDIHSPTAAASGKFSTTKIDLGEKTGFVDFGKPHHLSSTRIGEKPEYGWKYQNPHLFPVTGNPNTSRIAVLEAFLPSLKFIPPVDPKLPIRQWWEPTATDPMEQRLQRLVVSCFDEQSLTFAQTGSAGPADVYKKLYQGLIRKTHTHGSAAPHHFDVMLSIVQLYLDLTPTSNAADLTKMFGADFTAPDRMKRYTKNIGLMCSGVAGNFARYGTVSGRPGRWNSAGEQTLDGGSPILPCPVTFAERGSVLPPPFWDLAGQEGANNFGLDFGGKSLARTNLQEIKPGDYVCYLGEKEDVDVPPLNVGSHVLIVDEIESKSEKTISISTVESCGEDLVDGMVFTTGVNVTHDSGDQFIIEHLAFRKKRVHIRRINHFRQPKAPRHDLTDI